MFVVTTSLLVSVVEDDLVINHVFAATMEPYPMLSIEWLESHQRAWRRLEQKLNLVTRRCCENKLERCEVPDRT